MLHVLPDPSAVSVMVASRFDITRPRNARRQSPWPRMAVLGSLGAALAIAPHNGANAQTTPSTVLIVSVSDVQTGQALQGAEVFLPALSKSGRADALGEARIGTIPSGTHRIRVRFLGYAAMDTSLTFEGDTAGVLFRLERAALTMDAVEVTAPSAPRLREFEMRRRIGSGRYLTGDELGRDSNRPFGVVAMTRFPGLQLVHDGDGRPHIASVRGSCGVGVSPSEGILAGARGGGSGGRGAASGGGTPTTPGPGGGSGNPASAGPGTRSILGSCTPGKACYVVMFLDDIQLDSADFDLITTWDIAAVEYYTGNSVPPRYRVSGAACGVMLVWSK